MQEPPDRSPRFLPEHFEAARVGGLKSHNRKSPIPIRAQIVLGCSWFVTRHGQPIRGLQSFYPTIRLNEPFPQRGSTIGRNTCMLDSTMTVAGPTLHLVGSVPSGTCRRSLLGRHPGWENNIHVGNRRKKARIIMYVLHHDF